MANKLNSLFGCCSLLCQDVCFCSHRSFACIRAQVCVFTELLCANVYARIYLCLLTFLSGFYPLFYPISNLLPSHHSSFRCLFSERGSLKGCRSQVGDVMVGSDFERETLPGERPLCDSGLCPTCSSAQVCPTLTQ